ncbi:hypothetical protein SAMN05421786_102193 [Chryseobacterium ureilyticum]|uniref:Uncharacterized protein n=1 Tax=Chryseobacterium ureilyticum TaxID=373668 RepID=A0A1N7M1Y0_9FLAO|nr:hypothetical protein [Chryseobacterium ureilyticum]SIS80062.1 hypothetical protein SAMN05421786_102193 [Chryseobacterium ureilyticum]
MKNKLRKIVVDNLEYLYTVTDTFHPGTETNTLTVKIFLIGKKQFPLSIDFLTFDDYIMGQPLKSGVSLVNTTTNSTENVNLNEPQYIRKFILLGRENGWTGENILERQNGVQYLANLGFEIEKLKPV